MLRIDLKHQHQGLLQENEALRLETADLKDDVESLQIEVEALRNELEQAGEEEGGGNTGHSQELVDGGQAEPDVEGRMNRFQRVETREASDLVYLENQQISTVGNVYSCSRTTFVRADDPRLRRCAQRRRSFAKTTRSCSRKCIRIARYTFSRLQREPLLLRAIFSNNIRISSLITKSRASIRSGVLPKRCRVSSARYLMMPLETG